MSRKSKIDSGKKVEIQKYIDDHSFCSEYLFKVQQSGKGRDEPENAAVPDGAFGHRRHDERIHASGTGGCGSRDGQDGGSRVSSERAAEDLRWRRKQRETG